MKLGLKVLLGADSFFISAAGMLGPIYAIYVKNIGGDILTASTAWSIFMVITGIGVYFIGRTVDRTDSQEKFVILGYALMCCGFLGYLFVSNPLQLFTVQIILGLGEAICVPGFDSLYSKFLTKGKFASGWATWGCMYRVVTAISGIIGGVIASTFGFQILFGGMFCSSLMGLFISTKLAYNDVKNDGSLWKTIFSKRAKTT